ncbi:hypothetical protein PTKIN_Ptkin01aG0079200 [Pterospermum kingtungense]
MGAVPKQTVMAVKSYQNQAQILVKNYLFADPFIPYTSILGGILACKLAYDLTQLISSFYIKTYPGLTKIQRVEWNSRGISTVHAIFVSALSLYFVFLSDLFSDQHLAGLLVFRSSPLSTFGLGVSVGYFLSDLGMILWLYPSLGGIEYVSVFSMRRALQLTFICLFNFVTFVTSIRNNSNSFVATVTKQLLHPFNCIFKYLVVFLVEFKINSFGSLTE